MQDYLDQHAISMYGLLPTMQGADLTTLTQAIEEMRLHYKGDETRLSRELLCFRILLQRATTVPVEDKQQLKERLKMFNDLFEDDPFIQEKKAEGLAEGLARGLAEGEVRGEAKGEAKGLQTAVVTIVEGKFPALVPLAQRKVRRVYKPDLLNMLLRQVAAANDEEMARLLLDTFAA